MGAADLPPLTLCLGGPGVQAARFIRPVSAAAAAVEATFRRASYDEWNGALLLIWLLLSRAVLLSLALQVWYP